SDSKNYYQATDAGKLKGCESVTISVTCSDGVTLGSGTTQYKCSSCGSSLNNHSKECAMKTTVGDNSLDLSELDKQEQEATGKITMLQSQISQLESENVTLLKLITTASLEDAALYRQQYNHNKEQIDTLKKELSTWQQNLKDIILAKEEASEDNAVATDDYYRIPAIMNDCRTVYNLTWQGEGSWSGYTYTRKATMPNINGIITFSATLSISRKPKYFLGIKIHRAIMQISWSLTSAYTNTSVVDVMILDASKSDQEKADEVNKRISEIAREYPSCKITTEYAKTAPTENNTTDETKHLLWSSDRLEIAMEVDSRITKIYADLVSLEKMMHYKRSILDVLKDVAPRIDDNQGRRYTLVEECRKRWLQNAAERKHSVNYNGKYGEDTE
ncbi:MAG: hypothetical protein ACRCZM_04415, partial [Bacteroidales bacterium]